MTPQKDTWINKEKGGKSDPIKILQLYTKYRLQKDAYDPEAENTLNQLKAEENEVHDLDSFIDEIKYRWKGNPWLGGYNKTLNEIFSWPSRYDTFKKSTNPTKDNSILKFIDLKQFIKPAKKQQGGRLIQPSWIGQNNGTVDKRELQNRTGQDGVVYSNAATKNLFNKQTLKKPWEQDLKLQVTPITSINQFKQGGIMCKYQQGGAVSNDPMDQIAQLSAAFLQGDTKSGQQLVEILNNKEIGPQLIKAVQQGVKQQDQRATIIAQAIQTLTQGNTRKARLGAKLNYIRQSIGECPEGEEVIYFKKGGEICKRCSGKKLQKGGKSDPVKDFKKKKEQDAVKKSYELNPYTRGKSAKEIAEMQKRNNQEASRGEGESPADIAPWRKKNNIKKHQQGGWINKDKKIWNWDSMDRFNRVKNWYQGKSNKLSDEDWGYLLNNPELESALHNIYKVSKLPNKRTTSIIAIAQYANNMPKGADPNARIPVVPDSTNNFKGRLGVGQFKMLEKPKQQTPKQKPKQQTSFAKKENAVRRNHFNNWTTFVKKYYPSILGSFKKTMENAGYTYDWNTGIYSKSGSAYRLNNGQLQTQNIYTGNWNNISNTDSLPGMPAVTMAIRSQK